MSATSLRSYVPARPVPWRSEKYVIAATVSPIPVERKIVRCETDDPYDEYHAMGYFLTKFFVSAASIPIQRGKRLHREHFGMLLRNNAEETLSNGANGANGESLFNRTVNARFPVTPQAPQRTQVSSIYKQNCILYPRRYHQAILH